MKDDKNNKKDGSSEDSLYEKYNRARGIFKSGKGRGRALSEEEIAERARFQKNLDMRRMASIENHRGFFFDKVNIIIAIIAVGFSIVAYIIDSKLSEYKAELKSSQTEILSEIKVLRSDMITRDKEFDSKLQIQKLELEKEIILKKNQ